LAQMENPFDILIPTPSPETKQKLGWLIGLLPAVGGCLFTSLGLVFMKHSSSSQITNRMVSIGWWALGFTCLVIVPLPLNMITFSMTPICLAAPFNGLAILFSLGLARCGVLSVREAVTWKHMRAVALLLSGVGFASAFGPHSNKEIPLEKVPEVFDNVAFMVLFVTCMVIVISYLSSFLLPKQWKLAPTSTANVVFLGFTAATCGAFCQLLLKVISQALGRTLNGDSQVGKPALYVVIGLVLTFAPLQLYLLNVALANSNVVFAVPLYQSLLLTLTMAVGGAFFSEFNELTWSEAIGFVFGTLLVIVGLGWLALVSNAQNGNGNKTSQEVRDLARGISVEDALGGHTESTISLQQCPSPQETP